MSKTRVYVGDLPEDVRERDVERFFKGYGRLCDILIKNRFCFVEFTHSRDAEDAIHDLDGKKLLGKRVILQNARNKPRGRDQYARRDYSSQRSTHRFSPARRTPFGAIVENLSSRVQWQDLKDFLTKAGKVTYAKAHNVKKNQGMVEFDTYEDLQKVIKELDGAELYGRRIVIKEAKRLSRSRSRSSGSKSTSRLSSRSRSRSQSSIRKSRSRSPSPIRKSRSRSPSPIRKSRSRSRSSKSHRSSSPMPKSSSKRLREEQSRSRSRSNCKRTKKSQSKSKSPQN